MKKYALITSVLAIAASNCMEKKTLMTITSPDKKQSITITLNENRNDTLFSQALYNRININPCTKTVSSKQFSAEVQEKISLEPEMIFLLNDKEVQKLRTALIQKEQIQSKKTELFNNLSHSETPVEKKESIIQELINFERQDKNLDRHLNIHLTPEDQQLLDNLDDNIRQITSKINMSNPQINELITDTNSVIDQLIPLYRKAESVQQFIENELMKNKSDALFINMKEKCESHINQLTQTINHLTEGIGQLTKALQIKSNK